MAINVGKELAALQRMTTAALREKFAAVFGEATTTGNRTWLVRRIAWRLQADAEGDLSARARQRAAELARDADLRIIAPKEPPAVLPMPHGAVRTGKLPPPAEADDRLPPPGTVLTRRYKGRVLQVKVLAGGFEYEGELYGSLSAVAKAATGSHCNGFAFFGLAKGGSK